MPHVLKNSESCDSIDKIVQHQKPAGNHVQTLERRIDLFYSSIKSRMLVAEVVNGIKAGSEFTFDYLLLVVLASIIAFLGLITCERIVRPCV